MRCSARAVRHLWKLWVALLWWQQVRASNGSVLVVFWCAIAMSDTVIPWYWWMPGTWISVDRLYPSCLQLLDWLQNECPTPLVSLDRRSKHEWKLTFIWHPPRELCIETTLYAWSPSFPFESWWGGFCMTRLGIITNDVRKGLGDFGRNLGGPWV